LRLQNLSLVFAVVVIGLPIWVFIWLVSGHGAIVATVGSSLVVSIINTLWGNHHATLASPKAAHTWVTHNQRVLALAEALIDRHATELSLRRRQLTVTLSYGVVDDSKWLQEIDFFIDNLMKNQGCDVRDSPSRLRKIKQMINTATAHSDSEPSPGGARRGMPWIALIVVILMAALLMHVTQP
jgi:hypothetical protein